MFTWIPIYKEIAQRLLDYEKRQDELITLMQKIKEQGIPTVKLKDKKADGTFVDLYTIDPFTFFATFNRGITESNRKRALRIIKEEWSLEKPIPDDFSGIPLVNNQKSFFFEYEGDRRTDKDIPNLWKLFKEALSDGIKEETFNNVLKIYGVNRNITIGLFWIDPVNYLSMESIMSNYLKEKGYNHNYKDFNEYMSIIEKIKEDFDDEFYQISFDAWKEKSTEEVMAEEGSPLEGDLSEVRFWVYAPGQKAHRWKECISNNEIYLGFDPFNLGDLKKYKNREVIRSHMQEVMKKSSSFMNHSLATWQFAHEMKEGDIIIPKKGLDTYLGYGVVTGSYYFDDSRSEYKHVVPVEWRNKNSVKEPSGNIVQKTLTDITKYKDDIKQLVSLLNIEFDVEQSIENELQNMPKNLILYGPPGTGKTYQIQDNYMPLFTTYKKQQTKREYLQEVVQELSWFNVILLAILDYDKVKVPDLSKHELIQIKREISTLKDLNARIWATLQSHTLSDCPHVNYARTLDPLVFWKTDDSYWSVKKDIIQEIDPDLYEFWETINNYKPKEIREERYRFVTFHQSFSYEDFVEGIKPQMASEGENKDLSYHIQDGIFKEMCTLARINPDKKWALFVDEINRGNVAGIFGELITLLEDDKRGKFPILLPYSKEEFTVPENLYLIGTMNTADRSIEALDTALRRRFSFIEVTPDPSLLSPDTLPLEGIDLEQLLEALNKRVSLLLDKDHMIGHSYFMKIENKSQPLEELQDIFRTRIIPLLEEYFYGDRSRLKMVLGPAFVNEIPLDTDLLFDLDNGQNTFAMENEYAYDITIPETMEGFRSLYEKR